MLANQLNKLPRDVRQASLAMPGQLGGLRASNATDDDRPARVDEGKADGGHDGGRCARLTLLKAYACPDAPAGGRAVDAELLEIVGWKVELR